MVMFARCIPLSLEVSPWRYCHSLARYASYGHVRTMQDARVTVRERLLQCKSLILVSLLMYTTCTRGEKLADGLKYASGLDGVDSGFVSLVG